MKYLKAAFVMMLGLAMCFGCAVCGGTLAWILHQEVATGAAQFFAWLTVISMIFLAAISFISAEHVADEILSH